MIQILFLLDGGVLMTTKQKVFCGNLLFTPEFGRLELLKQALMIVDDNGMISAVIQQDDEKYEQIRTEAKQAGILQEFLAEQYLLPGFVDLHIHASQWPQAGIALDDPLNVWLDECTFPLESKYQDLDFAREVYNDLVEQLLARATTTAVYFATQHLEASYELAKISAQKGQRAFVGKVVMDNPKQTPDFYRDKDSQSAIADTKEFIRRVKQLGKDVKQGVYPVITPRFVPSCTDETLAALGKLAQETDAYVQTHCSEGQWEHDYVLERFGKRDTEVLADFGLLKRKSIMDHCNFVNEADGELFAKKQAAIAHCPISNAYFANGVLQAKRLHKQGVKVGLGTDISGGFSPSLYDNIKQCVMSSRMLEDGVDVDLPAQQRGKKDSRLSVLEAFYLATKGGGQAVCLPLGSFEVGQICDFQVLDPTVAANKLPGLNIFKRPVDILAKLLYLSTPANIKEVWVQGQRVK